MRTFSAGQICAAAGMMVLAGAIWNSKGSDTAQALAGQALALVATAGDAQAADPGGQSASPGQVEDGKAGAAHAGKDVYGIVNLVSLPGYGASVNARGQAAFEYISFDDDQLHVGFFNGERTIDISPPNHAVTAFSALNEKGEVALRSRLLQAGSSGPFLPFRWSPARGLVPLRPMSPEGETFIGGMNNQGEIVGTSNTADTDNSRQAVRWTAANRLLPLPGVSGIVQSSALGINERNVSVGYGHDARGASRVLVWDASGRPATVGGFGTSNVTASEINNRGDISGMLDIYAPNFSAFLWSPVKGVVRIGSNTIMHAMNEAGELVGRMRRPDDRLHAFLYSRARGLVNLHPASMHSSEAEAVNDSGVVVGLARPGAGAESFAYRWSRSGAVNLNTRLLDAPAGLVLTDARAISANGDIVADSNAGFVLLRPGGAGTDAPVLGPMQFSSLRVGELTHLTLSFRDRNVGETHTATIDWDDGRGPQPAAVRESRGRGEVRAQHTFPAWGGYKVVVRVTDSSRRTTTLSELVSAHDSNGPGLVGSGVLAAAAAQGIAAPPTMFRLAVPLAAQAGARPFTFQLLGHTTFKGEQLDRVSVEGNRVRLEGRGQLEGRPGYRFAIDASAGEGAASRMAVRITADETNGGARLAVAAGENAGNGQAALAAELRRGSLRLVKPAASQR